MIRSSAATLALATCFASIACGGADRAANDPSRNSVPNGTPSSDAADSKPNTNGAGEDVPSMGSDTGSAPASSNSGPVVPDGNGTPNGGH